MANLIPADNKTMIDCSGNDPNIITTWCENIFGYTQPALGQHKTEEDYISVPAPAQPPPSPGPLTKVSITVDNVTRNGTRLDVQLAIHNSGSTEFTSMEISEIGLQTLAGAGHAKLLDPLPIHIGEFAPGNATTIVLHLHVPRNVDKLELAESGTADTGDSSPYWFTLGAGDFSGALVSSQSPLPSDDRR